MPDIPHLLIPYAVCQSEGCQQALTDLALPHLDALLTRLTPAQTSAGEETSLSPPHERAQAQALGLPTGDGRIPWAAWTATQRLAQEPPPGDGSAWAFITPCQWQVGADHVTLGDPAELGLNEAASRALLAILAPWFAEDGITLHYEQPTRWLAQGAPFADLATASLERVLRRDVRAWLPAAAQARNLHRLHSEMQMLLYTHPFNDTRATQGLPPVNAFWVHGTGPLPLGIPPAAQPTMAAALRDAALREDWRAWAAAWAALDAGPLAALRAQLARGDAVRLTLCGERNAITWHSARRSLVQRVQSLLRPQRFPRLHNQL